MGIPKRARGEVLCATCARAGYQVRRFLSYWRTIAPVALIW
jgi:hypothetical protein